MIQNGSSFDSLTVHLQKPYSKFRLRLHVFRLAHMETCDSLSDADSYLAWL